MQTMHPILVLTVLSLLVNLVAGCAGTAGTARPLTDATKSEILTRYTQPASLDPRESPWQHSPGWLPFGDRHVRLGDRRALPMAAPGWVQSPEPGGPRVSRRPVSPAHD